MSCTYVRDTMRCLVVVSGGGGYEQHLLHDRAERHSIVHDVVHEDRRLQGRGGRILARSRGSRATGLKVVLKMRLKRLVHASAKQVICIECTKENPSFASLCHTTRPAASWKQFLWPWLTKYLA